LLAGEDAGFDDRGIVAEPGNAGGADFSVAEKGEEFAGSIVAANASSQFGVDAEGGKIPGHIGGTTRVDSLFIHMNHRDGGFRGNSRNTSVDEFIEHQVANDKNPEPPEPSQGGPQLGRGKMNVPHP
jgi:hypothetical protein